MPRARIQKATPAPNAAEPLFISNYGLVLTVYILYLAGIIMGLPALIGVIIASLQSERTDPISRTHFQFQIRTFWIGLLYAVVGILTVHIGIGAVVLLWTVVWTLIRCVKGMLALNAGEPIGDPNSWWFG
ncbi:MAG TPA: hypothetical protein VK430_04665 [Xanthobacteraceae bacterium]|nr:hypothetical protein [Xanthobacteraceae bacterium]